MKTIAKYTACLFLLALCSCEAWLDVKPTDRISGRALFETRQGFTKALNGVYVDLTDRSVYGLEMTGGMIDMMAQYYWISGGTNNYYDQVRKYNYEDTQYGVKTRIDNMWKKSYNLIVNLNIIIEECGEQNSVLPGIWHHLIKGEALALRAYLHLDMLRIFGPTYASNPDMLCIPYVTNTDQSVSPLRTASEMREFILGDLNEAIALLAESDPIIENGVMASDSGDGDNSLRYRQYRMNYYAARAVLARAQLWFGDNGDAYTTATELLAEIGEEVFPFVNADEVTKGTNPDRVFSPEVMFALYDTKRTTEVYDAFYSPLQDIQNVYRLAYAGNEMWSGRVSELFVTPNDIRYKAWLKSYTPNTGGVLHYICKYQGEDSGTSKPQSMYIVPLVRLSEVYLIAAETATNLEEGKGYLSKVRTARGAYDLESADREALIKNIEWEYRREFLGEGQMFYFYKRLGRESIPDGNSSAISNTIPMGAAQYVVPLPDSETDERVDNN